MKAFNSTQSVLLALSLFYAVLFFNFEIGLNLLLFDLALIIAVLRTRPELARHTGVVWSIAGMLISAFSVVIVHSTASMVAHHLSYLLVLGFSQHRELRFVWYGLLLGISRIFSGAIDWWKARQQAAVERVEKSGAGRFVPLAIAVLVALPFLFIYTAANEVMGNFIAGAWGLVHPLRVADYSIRFVVLTSFAFLLIAGIFFRGKKTNSLIRSQEEFSDQLDQVEVQQLEEREGWPIASSKLVSEARVALYVFLILNLLAFTLNLFDLRFVWLKGETLTAATLSHYVHEGTENLIISVALAIVLILYFFRGQLNFEDNTQVKRLAQLWIIQNGLLLLSVGARNYHYVQAYGLATGRIYVVFALVLLLFSLLSLSRKVRKRLSITYLLQTNGMALWLALLVFGAVNWSGIITRYNLHTQAIEEIDWKYLYRGFDGRNAFFLETHPKAVAANGSAHIYRYTRLGAYRDWRGWNYSSYRALRVQQLRENTPALNDTTSSTNDRTGPIQRTQIPEDARLSPVPE